MKVFRFLFLLFVSLPLFGASRLWMDPLGPTTATPIVFWFEVSCESPDEVLRFGNTILISLRNGPCSPPRTEPLRIPLPERTLPAGEYRVDVAINTGAAPPIVLESHTFFVRHDENENVRFRVRPSVALSVGGVPLLIEPEDPDDDLCPTDCKVYVDGVERQKDRLHPGLRIIAPPHDGGPVDIAIELPDGTRSTVSNILYYYHPNEYPHFSVFERILFPLLEDLPGAGGSLWRVETAIANPNRWWVDNVNYVQPLLCVIYPCAERMEPRAFAKFDGGEYPRGVALLTPRAEAPYLSFASRVRDLSQQSESFGTQLPVVRERDMSRDRAVTLLDVPRDPRYRVKLRLYALDDSADQTTGVLVTFEDIATKTRTFDVVSLTRTCTGNACAAIPYYAELNLRSEPGVRANITIENPGPNRLPRLLWGLASITNNATQQVTIVSPNGGGDPCPECMP